VLCGTAMPLGPGPEKAGGYGMLYDDPVPASFGCSIQYFNRLKLAALLFREYFVISRQDHSSAPKFLSVDKAAQARALSRLTLNKTCLQIELDSGFSQAFLPTDPSEVIIQQGRALDFSHEGLMIEVAASHRGHCSLNSRGRSCAQW
jgi:hypothetical protein